MMNECTGYWLDNHVLSEPPTCKTILPKFISPRADGAGTNSRRLFTPGETKALAKSKVHQSSRAWLPNDISVGGHPH